MEGQAGIGTGQPAYLETVNPPFMPTKRQKEDFALHAFESALETSIDWIQDNLKPDEVFEETVLKAWVGGNAKPGDVFDEEDLEVWAKANGFVKF